jgi:hypothetical protein
MRALTCGELLDVWERSEAASAAQRAIGLLAASLDQPPEAVAALNVGRRDAQLLQLRELMFGHTVEAVTTCPHCGSRIDLAFRTDDIRASAAAAPGETFAVAAAPWRLTLRLPNAADLAALPRTQGLAAARETLFERCLVAVEGGPPPARWPPAVLDLASAAMAVRDPQAQVELALTCPACAERWNARFDIPSFLWSEIVVAGRRLTREVHALALAYGWSEHDALALSPWRRRKYLELAQP